MDKKLRIGFIGCGGIAGEHMRCYKKLGDGVEVVAFCDIVPGRAKEFAERYDIKDAAFYESYEEMLDREKLDGVSVCTYNMAHAAPAIAAMRHGVYVLLEKPIAGTVEDAVAILRAEKETGRFASVGFQPRYNADMKKIKEICQSGVLGKIYYIQTGGGRRCGLPGAESFVRSDTAGIGAMGDIGCYSLDMVLNAIGYPKPLTVTGYTSNFFGKDPQYFLNQGDPAGYADLFQVEDFAAGFIRLEGDIILDFRIAWAMHLATPGDTIIMGTKGSLRIPSTDCWNGDIGGDLILYQTVAGELVETKFARHEGTREGDFYHKIRSFLDAVKTGGKAPVPVSQILYNQAIIDGIIKSNKLGREIEVEIPEI